MTEFEKIMLEKLDNIENDISGMKVEMSDMKEDISGIKAEMSSMKNDISALKKTAIKVETDLIPKTKLMLDSYMSIAEKVNSYDDLHEEVAVLRYEVDVLKTTVSKLAK